MRTAADRADDGPGRERRAGVGVARSEAGRRRQVTVARQAGSTGYAGERKLLSRREVVIENMCGVGSDHTNVGRQTQQTFFACGVDPIAR